MEIHSSIGLCTVEWIHHSIFYNSMFTIRVKIHLILISIASFNQENESADTVAMACYSINFATNNEQRV